MMSLFWLLAALHVVDPCAPSVEPPVVGVKAESMEISIARSYGIPWAVCAQEAGGSVPTLRITAKDGAGSHVLLDRAVELGESLREGTRTFTATANGCEDTAPNRRDAGAVLQGPVGSRHWYNRRTIEVELSATGPFAPLAFKVQTEVFCRACADDRSVSFSFYVNDFDKNTTRMVVSLDKARWQCAKGGGRMALRHYWTDPDADPWLPLRPYEAIDNLQDRLRADGESMVYESIEPMSRFCKAGKSHVYELIGFDEYASLVRRNYGPSDAIHRGGIEFLRCK